MKNGAAPGAAPYIWKGRVCERIIIALPTEADEEQRVALARAFGEALTKGKAGYLPAVHDKKGNNQKRKETTSGLGTINSTVVKSDPISVPPVDVQKDMMVVEFEAALAQVRTLMSHAATVRAQAWTHFESAVYAAEDAEDAADLIVAVL